MNSASIDWCDEAEIYALGGLSPEEAEVFKKHLAGCAACQTKIAGLRQVVELLPYDAEPVKIPDGMRGRILGNVLQQEKAAAQQEVKAETAAKTANESSMVEKTASKPTRSSRTTGRNRAARIVNGLAWAAAIFLLIYSLNLRSEIRNLKEQAASAEHPIQAGKVDQAVALSAAAQDIVAKGLATIVIDKSGTHLIVQTEKMPELKNTEAYQVWLLKDKQVVNAGTFLTDNGTGALYFTLSPEMRGADQIAITLEPDAYGNQPRGKIVLAAKLRIG